jgi:hypothetical protein
MTDTRTFPLADILSITTGRLLSREHMGGIYKLLDFMTGDNLMTHQLGRGADACRPALLAQHPQLEGVEPPDDIEAVEVLAWLCATEQQHGIELPVTPLAEWQHINPIEELCDMVGPERVYVVPVEQP